MKLIFWWYHESDLQTQVAFFVLIRVGNALFPIGRNEEEAYKKRPSGPDDPDDFTQSIKCYPLFSRVRPEEMHKASANLALYGTLR